MCAWVTGGEAGLAFACVTLPGLAARHGGWSDPNKQVPGFVQSPLMQTGQ